jgi:23S rRNA U2552 (ribose-2'-O)-methylase RlmE/FtsJ
MEIILAPDIYVNASVAFGSPPDQVARRVLTGKHGGRKSSEWVLSRVRQMLKAIPNFRMEAVDEQVALIRGFVQIVPVGEHPADAWAQALVATAQAAGALRVVTDHPDLLELEATDGVEFMSSEAWLVEAATPPPAPVQSH